MTENNAAQAADVLVDYEVYQEDELVASSNSLAHAEQYAEQYRQDGPVELRTSISIPGFHAVESALLSKLRAEGVQAGDERAIDAAALLGKYKKLCIEIGRGDSSHLGRIDTAIAAVANTSIAVPENWKLVPLKPTSKMMGAWYDAFNANIKSAARSTLAYRALIDAAPDVLASAPVAEPYDSEQRCRAYYDSDLRPFAADGLAYNVWQAVWHAAQFDRAMYPNSSKPRPHSAPAAGEAQGVSVERLAKDPFLAAQLWRNPVDRAPTSELFDAELRIGVSATDQGATICIMQPHTDGTITVVYTETHPLGDSLGRAVLARGSK